MAKEERSNKLAFSVCCLLLLLLLLSFLTPFYQAPDAPNFIRALRAKHGLKSKEEQREEEMSAKFRKRERLQEDFNDDRETREDEQPVWDVM